MFVAISRLTSRSTALGDGAPPKGLPVSSTSVALAAMPSGSVGQRSASRASSAGGASSPGRSRTTASRAPTTSTSSATTSRRRGLRLGGAVEPSASATRVVPRRPWAAIMRPRSGRASGARATASLAAAAKPRPMPLKGALCARTWVGRWTSSWRRRRGSRSRWRAPQCRPTRGWAGGAASGCSTMSRRAACADCSRRRCAATHPTAHRVVGIEAVRNPFQTLPCMSCRPQALASKEPTGAGRILSQRLPQPLQLACASPMASPQL